MRTGITVNEFKHVPGVNDAEYIALLEHALEQQKALTSKAISNKYQACPLVHYRGRAQGHEFDYPFCCCAKERTDKHDESTCQASGGEYNGKMSDGYHTFDDLYHQRTVLFAALANQNTALAWKTRRHADGSFCGDGWFIAGIDTPEGSYTYHCAVQYWDMYNCKEVKKVPHFDGHTSEDVGRLLSLAQTAAEKEEMREYFTELVYDELASDPDWSRANRIIEAADEYADAED